MGGRFSGHGCPSYSQPNVALSVYTADSVPLLFLDPVQKAIGVAHAGWRGSVNGIAVLTLQLLQQHFSSRPEDILVAIGLPLDRVAMRLTREC